MSEPAFFQTRMGRKFFEGTMPQLADAMANIARSMASQRVDPGELEMNARNQQVLHELQISYIEYETDSPPGSGAKEVFVSRVVELLKQHMEDS